MAGMYNLAFCKPRTLASLSFFGIALYIFIHFYAYDQDDGFLAASLDAHDKEDIAIKSLTEYRMKAPSLFSVTEGSTPRDIDSDTSPPQPTTSSCFQSPFVLCQTFSELQAWKPTLPNPSMFPAGKATPPVVFTNIPIKQLSYDYTRFQKFNFSQCPLPCSFRQKYWEADVFFIDATAAKDRNFPAVRYRKQIYISSTVETYFQYFGTFHHANSKFKDQINLTSTHRVDSDIPLLYNRLCLSEKPRKTKSELRQIFDRKTRSVAWFVSHCRTNSKRMVYVRTMKNYIDIDIYGRCGTLTYEKNNTTPSFLTDTYKFYLSFENSFCKDYVTEKFFRLFEPDVYTVSVVRGGLDYEKNFPPKTFINAENFKGPKELARFLKEVGNDFEKYREYLEARDKYTLQPVEYKLKETLCSMCTAAHELIRGNMTSRYDDIGAWLTKDDCRDPDMSWWKK